MIGQFIAAFFGTLAFAILFSVPRKYFAICGLIGGIGWITYNACSANGLSIGISTFAATSAVMVASRFCAVWLRCPVTVFLISGIFPLVPGAGLYWTVYYLVQGNAERFMSNGLNALKSAFAIVLGIVVIYELPPAIFTLGRHGKH